MTRTYLGWSPIDIAVLDGDGSDLADALGSRIPPNDPDLERFLTRRVKGQGGWRIVFEGQVPDHTKSYAIRLASPVADGWQVATFVPQQDGGWSAMLESGPVNPHFE